MADNSSNKKPRFLPDPSKWIQTAPSRSSAKKPQRPLTSFRNTFATPPTTIKRLHEKPTAGPSQVKRQGQGHGQGSQVIPGFFTPPTTITSQKRVGATKNDTPSRLPTTTTGKTSISISRKSRLYVRADEEGSSPDSGDEVVDKRDSLLRNQDRSRTDERVRPPTTQHDKTRPRAKVMPLQSHRSAPVTSSSSGMSDAIDQDLDMITPVGNGSRKRRKYRTLTSSPSPSPSPSPTPVFPPGSPDHPLSSHMSSDRPITPVPDYVLEIHRRLCGRDERIRRNESSLKPIVKKSRKEIEKEKEKHAIDERAHDQALIRRRRVKEKENEQAKRLVAGSSQPVEEGSISPKSHGKRKRGLSPVDLDIAPLAPMIVNTIHHGVPAKRESTHTDLSGARKRPARSNAFSPSAVYEELCGHRSPSPRRELQTPPKSRSLRRIPTGQSPGSAIPLTSPSPIKPVTPPTSSPSAGSMPPPPDPEDRYAGREFKAVPMQAETLLSWSGGLASTSTPRKKEVTASGTPVRPDPRPIQHDHHHDRESLNKAEEKDSETQSLAPSVASQSFPNILPSPTRPIPSMFNRLDPGAAQPTAAPHSKGLSATKTKTQVIMPETIRRTTTSSRLGDAGSSRSIARFPTDLGVAETVLPNPAKSTEIIKGRSKSPTTTPKLKSRASAGWPAFGFDETTPTNPGNKRTRNPDDASPNKSTTKKRKSSPLTAKPITGTQSKLAAFGFFGEKPKKEVRGFEDDWEMEDDLPFEADIKDRPQMDRKHGDERGLKAVPPPPPHPALRPAGLKELKKREEALAASRPRFERLEYNDNENDEKDNDIEQLFPDVQPSSSQTPAHVGSSTSASASSSFTTDDELTGMGSSAAAWWDGLEDRRSSEFGSFT